MDSWQWEDRNCWVFIAFKSGFSGVNAGGRGYRETGMVSDDTFTTVSRRASVGMRAGRGALDMANILTARVAGRSGIGGLRIRFSQVGTFIPVS